MARKHSAPHVTRYPPGSHSFQLEDNGERQPQLEPMQLSTTVMGPRSVAKPCGVEATHTHTDFQNQVSPPHLTAVRACRAQQ